VKPALVCFGGLVIAALGLAVGAHAAPPPGHSPRGVPEEIILRGTDSEGNELSLRVPVNILLAGPVQLQEPGNNANINLNQIGGSSVSSALYDGGNNALKVNCIVGCSAAGSFTDNSAFTTGSTSVTNVSGLFNDTATNLTSGNAGAIRATTDRMLFVNIGKIGGTVPTLTGSSLNVNCTGGCSSSAGFTDNSAFTAGTTTETNVGGVFNDGLSALSSGNAAAARITPNRGVHVNLRNNSGTEIATSGNPLRIDPTGTTTQPVSGTLTANIGTTNGLALDTSVNGLLLGQGSTSSGQKGPLVQCAATTGAPTDTTADTWPLSCNTSGGLRVDGSGVTQPVSGTVTANAGTGQFNVTCTAANCPVNVSQVAGTALGATAIVNYGSTPAAVAVPGVNAFITNTPAVTLASTTITGTVTVAGAKTNNNAAPGATNIGALPAIANAATQGWTEGDQVAESVDLSGRQRVRGTISDNGAAATSDLAGVAPSIYQTDYLNGTAATQGRNGAVTQGTDGLLWTAALPAMRPASYVASKKFAASSTTDNAVMPGNATNTVLLTAIKVTCTQTTAGNINVEILKRSAADTSGTSAAMTAVPDDSNYAAASSAPLSYTGTGPSVGTAVGDIDNAQIGCMASATATPNDIYILNRRQKPIVLRGTAQQVAVNTGNAAISGGNLTVTFEWIETKAITP
jgi:hypothetical protein